MDGGGYLVKALEGRLPDCVGVIEKHLESCIGVRCICDCG
jgi:hypothetical protein